MVYISRNRRDSKVANAELEDIEKIIWQADFLRDYEWYITRKQGRAPEELE
jgi:hypothetical protein